MKKDKCKTTNTKYQAENTNGQANEIKCKTDNVKCTTNIVIYQTNLFIFQPNETKSLDISHISTQFNVNRFHQEGVSHVDS